jgi:hypothetical protein
MEKINLKSCEKDDPFIANDSIDHPIRTTISIPMVAYWAFLSVLFAFTIAYNKRSINKTITMASST